MKKYISNQCLVLKCLAIILMFSAACSESRGKIIINSDPVYITNKKIILTLKIPIQTEGRFNQLCFEIPDGFEQDNSSWSMVSKNGISIVPFATLTTMSGTDHGFYQRSFLNNSKKYICLSCDVPISPHTRFKQITVWANLPFWTEGIIWVSSDKI